MPLFSFCNIYIAITENFSSKINKKAMLSHERYEIYMEQKLRQINDISLGNNLRNLRTAANLTQEQVVAQLQLRNLSVFFSSNRS